MAFWNVDLTTEDGALGATGNGAYACFIAAILTAISAFFLGGMTSDMVARGAMGVIALVAIGLFVVTGLRLRSGKGAFWGSVAVAWLGLEVLGKLLALSIPGLIINTVLLIVLINGVRGAWALRRGVGDDAGATFE